MMNLYKCLVENGIASSYRVLLTGYHPTVEHLYITSSIFESLRSLNPEAIWVLDPVMGDNDKLYVQNELVNGYKSLISRANVVIPNGYEFYLLSGERIENFDNLKPILKKAHEQFEIEYIVISSASIDGNSELVSIVSSNINASHSVSFCSYPSKKGYFSGTGDTFSALLTGHIIANNALKSHDSMVIAVQRSINGIQKLLSRTPIPENTKDRVALMRSAELRLVEARMDFIDNSGESLYKMNLL